MEKLVTIAVCTYNSSTTLIDTLDSVLSQRYSNIELIISDDASIDNTLVISSEWLKKYQNSNTTKRVRLITVPQNTGLSANCNRCIAAAQSDWIKFIAGDDILLPNCIEDNMAFVNTNPEAMVVFSQVKMYHDHFLDANYLRTTPEIFPNNLMNPTYTAKDQFERLLLSDRIHYTPSYFFNKQAILAVGGYDENNRLQEDYPMWLKLTQAGEKLHYFHKPTVGYRMHDKALNNLSRRMLFKPLALRAYSIRKKAAHPYLPWEIVGRERFGHRVNLLFQFLHWNKDTAFHKSLYRLFQTWLNPFQYIYTIKKRMKKYRNSSFYQ